MTNLKIAVLERGFVYIGDVEVTENAITIRRAKCIRRWGTTAGLGQLAREGRQENTRLDEAGTVIAPLSALNHTLNCDQAKWPEFADAEAAAPAAA
jgi:hypothetical protein